MVNLLEILEQRNELDYTEYLLTGYFSDERLPEWSPAANRGAIFRTNMTCERYHR